MGNQLSLGEENVHTQLQNILDARIATAQSLYDENEQISTVEVYAQNEQMVNALYLKQIITGYIAFDEGETDILKDIAGQCPLEGGRAVYHARALLYLAGIEHSYDDEKACVKEEIKSLRMPDNGILEEEISSLKVYPNPAKDKVFVEWTESNFENGQLIVYDLFGKELHSFALVSGQTDATIATVDLSSGVYFFSIQLDSNTPMVQKAIINK